VPKVEVCGDGLPREDPLRRSWVKRKRERQTAERDRERDRERGRQGDRERKRQRKCRGKRDTPLTLSAEAPLPQGASVEPPHSFFMI
jgi:hypothetical protein